MKDVWAMVLLGALSLLQSARHRPAFGLAILGALVLQSGGSLFDIDVEGRPPAQKCTHVAHLTQGPYWIDENIEAANVRSNLSYGVPLNITFKIINETLSALQGTCVPIDQARVNIWQCRYDGLYSDEEVESTAGETWLRGFQYTNSTGHASFLTIFPGWYIGRAAHIHVRVRIYEADDNTTSYDDTTQLFFDDTVAAAIFNDVYPYNIRGTGDTSFNNNDRLFRASNVLNLTGSYNDTDGYSSVVEMILPFTSYFGPLELTA